MVTKFLVRGGIVLVLAMGMAAWWSTQQVNGEQQVEPGVTIRVQSAVVEHGIAPRERGSDVVQRVRELASRTTPLFSPPGRYAYSADYTGLVGYAWELPKTAELANPLEWSHVLVTKYGVEIPYEMLRPGDVLANLRSGEYGHAIVFARWSNPEEWTSGDDLTDRAFVRAKFESGARFVGYQVDRVAAPSRVVERIYTLRTINGATTIQELDKTLYGPYTALRNNRIPGYADLVNGVFVFSKVKTGLKTPAQYVLVNRGGTPVRLRKITVAVYGPNADQLGLAADEVLFPEMKELVLAPGQVYEYRQFATLERAGSYVALPRFEVNGVLQSPLQPAYFQVVAR